MSCSNSVYQLPTTYLFRTRSTKIEEKHTHLLKIKNKKSKPAPKTHQQNFQTTN